MKQIVIAVEQDVSENYHYIKEATVCSKFNNLMIHWSQSKVKFGLVILLYSLSTLSLGGPSMGTFVDKRDEA